MKITASDLAAELAERVTDCMTEEDLRQHFYEAQFDYFCHEASDTELLSEAVILGFASPGEIELID